MPNAIAPAAKAGLDNCASLKGGGWGSPGTTYRPAGDLIRGRSGQRLEAGQDGVG
jgi:hypothetical protein